jgi:hypothetical protein
MYSARNVFIAAIGALLLAAAAYTFILLEVRGAVEAIHEISANIEREREKGERRESVRALFEQTEHDRRELESRLVDDTTLVSFFEKLEGLAAVAEADMKIENIVEDVELKPAVAGGADGESGPPPGLAPDILKWFQMDVSAAGPWENVYRFLVFLEALPYEVRFDNIRLENKGVARAQILPDRDEERIASPEADAGANTWTLSLSVRVLKLKND